MKKTAAVIAVTAGLAAAVCSTAVWTQGPPPPGGPGGPGRHGGPGGPMMSCTAMAVMPPQSFMVDHMAQTLKLTKSQAAKVKRITAKSDRTMRSLMQKAANANQSLRKALLASKYDLRKVRDLAAEAERSEAAVVSAGIDEWTQIRAILTAGQAAKLQGMMSMPPRPGRGGPGPGQFGPPPGEGGFPSPPPPGR
jgi:Spy/CpxP family protein refolding chaperone